jgi:hypothetical protein
MLYFHFHYIQNICQFLIQFLLWLKGCLEFGCLIFKPLGIFSKCLPIIAFSFNSNLFREYSLYGFSPSDFFFQVLELEPRALPMLGKHSSTEPQPQPSILLIFLICFTDQNRINVYSAASCWRILLSMSVS